MNTSLRACKRLACLLMLPCLLGACTATTLVVNTYERDELVAVKHNPQSDCTLLIYRDPLGQTRHVFRKHGIFELALTFRLDGDIELTERGTQPRAVTAAEAGRVTQRILEFMQVEDDQISSLSTI